MTNLQEAVIEIDKQILKLREDRAELITERIAEQFKDDIHELLIQNDLIKRATEQFRGDNLVDLDHKMIIILEDMEEFGKWLQTIFNKIGVEDND